MAYPPDNFRHGKILKFLAQGNYGFVKDEQGYEVYFHLDEVRLVGPNRDRSFFKEGTQVGFDVGLTSRGMRVTRLKVYSKEETTPTDTVSST
ncbi:MAG: cold shock domain-containing protein [Deltaproteobacteria bacterium]|nr:cold shock domain-containing protein [Deltaproteobacteria bacterium]